MWLKCDLEKKREGNTNRVKLFRVIFQIFCTFFAKPDTWLETPGFFRKKLRLWPALIKVRAADAREYLGRRVELAHTRDAWRERVNRADLATVARRDPEPFQPSAELDAWKKGREALHQRGHLHRRVRQLVLPGQRIPDLRSVMLKAPPEAPAAREPPGRARPNPLAMRTERVGSVLLDEKPNLSPRAPRLDEPHAAKKRRPPKREHSLQTSQPRR